MNDMLESGLEEGIILRCVRDELRKKYGWSKEHCRVMPRGVPLEQGPEFFVGVTDAGIEGSPVDGFYLAETFRLEVWVWRRSSQYPTDRHQSLMLDKDPHLGQIWLPSGLERAVKQFVHMNYDLMTAINDAAGTGTTTGGSGLQHPFVYQGSSATTPQSVNDGGGGQVYFGRQIRFGGALHIDPVDTTHH